jgi:hypothetical protein
MKTFIIAFAAASGALIGYSAQAAPVSHAAGTALHGEVASGALLVRHCRSWSAGWHCTGDRDYDGESYHRRYLSHRRRGSDGDEHSRIWSHRRRGSDGDEHSRFWSHRRAGSEGEYHSRFWSHRRSGSDGDEHRRSWSHRRRGSEGGYGRY